MMSSDETSSPVSASTFRYLILWPVFLLIWLKLIFSESEVAGYNATGQVTSERRKKPFQLARGAIEILHSTELNAQYRRRAKGSKVPKIESSTLGAGISDGLHEIIKHPSCLVRAGAPEGGVRCYFTGPFPCVRISSIQHMPVLFTFLDGVGYRRST